MALGDFSEQWVVGMFMAYVLIVSFYGINYSVHAARPDFFLVVLDFLYSLRSCTTGGLLIWGIGGDADTHIIGSALT